MIDSIGAEGGIRTPTGLLQLAPEASASAVPPLPQWRKTSRARTFSINQSRAYGAGGVAFQRTTIDAVAVLSLFTKPSVGEFEYRHRYPIFNARRAFMDAWAMASNSARYADESRKSG